jgi:Cd2+/Zn2+-exporting ATPase
MARLDSLSLPLRRRGADSCGLCADRLRDAVAQFDGVECAQVNASIGTLTVAFDPAAVSGEALIEGARRLEDDIAAQFLHQTYTVDGMDCAHCADGLEQMARAVSGVVSASVQFSAGRMRIEYDSVNPNAIEQIVRRARGMGFTLTEGDVSPTAADDASSPVRWRSWAASPAVRAGVSVAFLAFGLLLEHLIRAPEAVTRVLYGASILAGGSRFALAGLAALRQRVLGTNLLMALAAIGALAIGHWEEAAMVISLYSVGVALEGAATDRTRRSLLALIDARPAEALVQRSNLRQETVPSDQLVVGDLLVVKPGAKIAADGVIVSGASAVSEAAITGESLPKDRGRGDTIYAGSINGTGSLLVRVTAPAADSTLARLLHLVEEAQAQKAPTQAFVERFGRVYTPAVLLIAVLVALVGPLIVPGANWVYRALTLLVVACPCALIIATPVAYVSAIARAARGGVLVKGGVYLEGLAAARHVFLDKTGTLTTGTLRVCDIFATEEGPDAEWELLNLAAAMEQHSEHPIARAVVASAEKRNAVFVEATDAVAVPGRGIIASVAGEEALVGNAALLAERGVPIPSALAEAEARFAAEGKTTLLVALGGSAWGMLAVADTVRPEAGGAVAALQQAGRMVTMLTGDNAAVARMVGESVGVTDYRAALLPEEKLAGVQEAIRTGQSAVFVGDGINDAPALAAATVGVAMGSGGTAAALEAADLALMGDDLMRLPWAVRLAEATRGIVRFNIFLSVAAVILLLTATLAGHLSLPLGVLGHEGSALIVILNGVRLLSPRATPLGRAR